MLETALRPMADAEGGTYRLDLVKVSHHGSKANTSGVFPGLIDCTRFAVSTNGKRHNHPDRETIARHLVADPTREKTFFFNYRQPNTDVWDSAALKAMWHYETVFPVDQEDDPDNGRLVIDV